MGSIPDFLQLLAAIAGTATAFNPYAGHSRGSLVRRRNLSLYFHRMLERRPRLLLLGEAPGYRGCRVTGVPFTSEAILLADDSPFGLFGAAAGFAVGESQMWRHEASATAVWQTLVELDVLPLLWNAFPYHPPSARPTGLKSAADNSRAGSRPDCCFGSAGVVFDRAGDSGRE